MATGTVLYVRKNKSGGTDTEGSSSITDDNVWDDKALIEAFDQATSFAKHKVAERIASRGQTPLENDTNSGTAGKKRSRKRRGSEKQNWEVGAACRTVFSEDGYEYEAVIQSINREAGTSIIKYIGYDNEEEVSISDLKPSFGAIARQCQIQQALEILEAYYVSETDTEEPEKTEKCSESAESFPRGGGVWISQPKQAYNRPAQYSQKHFVAPHAPPFHAGAMGIPLPPPPPPLLTSRFPDEDSDALSAMLLSWYMSGYHTGYYQGLKEAKNRRTARSSGTTTRKR